jgi:hypothetical protein
MSANKHYVPAYIGGSIVGVSFTVQNPSNTDVSLTPYQGLFYVYQGQEYPLIVGNNDTIKAGLTFNTSREIDPSLIPSSDIKLMISTGDLIDCVINCNIMWSVE